MGYFYSDERYKIIFCCSSKRISGYFTRKLFGMQMCYNYAHFFLLPQIQGLNQSFNCILSKLIIEHRLNPMHLLEHYVDHQWHSFIQILKVSIHCLRACKLPNGSGYNKKKMICGTSYAQLLHFNDTQIHTNCRDNRKNLQWNNHISQ